MEVTITLDIIHETGYSTWYDFFGHLVSYSQINKQYHYGYHDSEGKEKSITLDIDKTIVSYLAETELLISIKEAGFDSFDACWKYILKQRQVGASTYHLKYIRVDKNKQVSFKDVSFSPELILSFMDLEKRTDKLTIYTAFPSE
jgi:hypothetical protein